MVEQATKYGFDFYLGSGESRTDVKSGCVGALTRDEAESLIRTAFPQESQDRRLSLAIYATQDKWPHKLVS